MKCENIISVKGLLNILFVCITLFSCKQSIKEKEFSLKEKELQLKERELQIKEQQLIFMDSMKYQIFNDEISSEDLIREKDSIITATQNERKELHDLFENVLLNYREKKKKVNSSNIRLTKEMEISEKRNKIQQLLSKVGATQEELALCRELIISLNKDIENY